MKFPELRVFMDSSLAPDCRIKIKISEFRNCAQAFIPAASLPQEINIIFVDNKKIRELNKEFRGIDRPTDVLSFNYEGGFERVDEKTYNGSTGEIYVSVPFVAKSSTMDGVALDQGIAAVVVHGLLHLAGYDHVKSQDAEIMKHLETGMTAYLSSKTVSVVC